MIPGTLYSRLLAAVLLSTVTFAQAAPTIYGNIFLSMDYVDQKLDGDDNSNVEINSNTSRIGFKGFSPLTQDTDVIYQLEYGTEIDGAGDEAFKSRDTYLGLLNESYGEIRMGRNYSVVDYINNVSRNQGYWYNIGDSTLDSKNPVKPQAVTLTDGSRINSSLVWISPKVDQVPFELALMYGADESFNDEDQEDGYGISLFYDKDQGFTAGIAYDKDMSINGDIKRATVSADLSNYITYPITLSALYQHADYDKAEKEKGLMVSADWSINRFNRPTSVYLQYNKADNLGGVDNFDSDQWVVGGRYEFKDAVIAHAYAGKNSADYINDTDIEVVAIGAGLQYLF